MIIKYLEAGGPENLPPAPPKHCERKGTMWGLQSHRVVLKGSHAGRHGSFLVYRLRMTKPRRRGFKTGSIAAIPQLYDKRSCND